MRGENKKEINMESQELHRNQNPILNEAALSAVTEKLTNDPLDISVLQEAASINMEMGRYFEALEFLEKAIMVDSQNFRSYFLRAFCLTELGHHKEALDDYQAVLDKAFIVRIENNREYAIGESSKVDGLLFDIAPFYNNRANSYAALGNIELATENYRLAISANPEYANSYSNFAVLLADLGAYDEALTNIQKSLALEPKNVHAYIVRGTIYAELNEDEAAILDYTKAIDLDDSDYLSWVNRGNRYADQSDFGAAINDYSQAIIIAPENAELYILRAGIYKRAFQRSNALADYNKAIELQPDNIEWHRYRDELLDKLRK